MIEAKDLVRTYPGIVALQGISFEVGKSEIVGFLGPNGAGKTTAMRILTCFLPPTSGSARVAGFDCVRQSMEVRRRIGYLPESNPLHWEMRVSEYLDFRAAIKGVPARDRKRRIEESCDRCGLKERRHSIIGTLSKGFRQRVGLADAILHDPEVLILDEPTIGLDPNQMREVRILIRELGKDRTVLLSTHILSEVEKVCKRILIISRGQIVAEGTPQQISEQLMKTGRIHLEIRGDGAAVKKALDAVPGVAHVLWTQQGDLNTYIIDPKGEDPGPALLRFAVEAGWDVVEFGPERLSLDDVFTIVTDGTRLVRREREAARG
ncbi:MAG: ATP-binding cassette domain-containing protein [Planctomycetes bacterium]|nr:ATP-binding cassette domain-containing protein [Planctomycetota bacterium]